MYLLVFVRNLLSVFALSLIVASASNQQNSLRGAPTDLAPTKLEFVHRSETQKQQDLMCRLTIMNTVYVRGEDSASEEDEIHCIPVVDGKESGLTYVIELPQEFIAEHNLKILTGTMYITVSYASVTKTGIATAVNSEFREILDVPDHLRRLVQTYFTSGTKTLAVIRISVEDSTPTYSLAQLKSTMYDGNVTLLKQYYACSYGQLNYVLSDTGFMDFKVTGKYLKDFATPELLVEEVQNRLAALGTPAETLGDTVLMCLPPGTPTSWIGKAPLRHWRAMFNDVWTVSISNVMHEIGHLMGLLHSGRDGNEYADITGYMSWGLRSPTYPRKCYNGDKSWDLAWYKDRHLKINLPADGPMKFNISAFTDYKKSAPNEPAVVNINDDLFLMYNRMESFNIETEEKKDQITVTQRWANRSDSKAGLSAGNKFQMNNYNGTGKTLTIEVCSRTDRPDQADVMEVSVGLDVSLCGVAVPVSVPKPTSAPVPKSAPPSRNPTDKPTKSPTPKPTASPTKSPTQPNTALGNTTASCDGNLFQNWDMEKGFSGYWDAYGRGQIINAPNYLSGTAIRSINRMRDTDGIKYLTQNLFPYGCLVPGGWYLIRFDVQLIDQGTGLAVSCDPDTTCPNANLLLRQRDRTAVVDELIRNYYLPSNSWDPDSFNQFVYVYQLPKDWDGIVRNFQFRISNFPKEWDLIIDNASFQQVHF